MKIIQCQVHSDLKGLPFTGVQNRGSGVWGLWVVERSRKRRQLYPFMMIDEKQ